MQTVVVVPQRKSGIHQIGSNPTKGVLLVLTHDAEVRQVVMQKAPATVITAEIDPLMSDGKMLAEKLEAAGVKTTYQNNEGVTHEFFGMDAVLDDAKRAQDFAVTDLKAAFSGTSSN